MSIESAAEKEEKIDKGIRIPMLIKMMSDDDDDDDDDDDE
jgi:hypothetical protein